MLAVRSEPSQHPGEPERLLTAGEVAEVLGVPRKRVYALPLPRYMLSEKCVRYRWSDLAAWLESRRVA
jgi:predicted DNA-binding transcriptional regulator AlpA